MAFDGIVTKHLIDELKTLLINGRIRKIYQPENDEIRLLINKERHNYNLLLSANANNPRLYLTEKLKGNPNTPPSFCMVLRKYLVNGMITDIRQHETDRVVEFDIAGKNEFNEPVIRTLLMEIMGRNSNVILIYDALIIDSMKKVGSSSNRYRQILPGKPYIYPPESDRHNFLTMTEGALRELLIAYKNFTIEHFFVQAFLGISPVIAREICFRAGVNAEANLSDLNKKQGDFLIQSYFEILDELKAGPAPNIYWFHHQIVDFSTVSLHHFTDTKVQAADSVSEMLESFYYLKDKAIRFKTKSANLKHQLSVLYKKNTKKLQNLYHDLADSKKYDVYKKKGDLITANIYRLKKGMEKVELIDYNDPDLTPVTLQLKVNESPAQNAQRFYKKYNKGKRAEIQLAEQIKTTKDQVYYLESLLNGLKQSTELDELDEIQHEFYHSEFYKKPLPKSKQKQVVSKPLHYRSSEGFDIFVGKNNYQNDYISTHLGNAEDCWLHVKDIPGSHVLIVANGRFITEATILEAGMLAAWHSRAQNSENVPVDYVEFSRIRKPKKAKPGMVIFTGQNTLTITADKNKIDALAVVED